ncbi:hypothetical protein [Candidatus Pseudomonas adelgestsugas]|uniref:hypothetical protein n=1 Tax=Candidatus Pseudomonas adelgestsugas TaxID=1302376 RepID=UPI001300AF79|nr:hypothetical protein [Candidatus Pseudomonas adelgestsugas]
MANLIFGLFSGIPGGMEYSATSAKHPTGAQITVFCNRYCASTILVALNVN